MALKLQWRLNYSKYGISLDIYKICIYHADSRQPQTQSTEQTPSSSVASLHSIASSYSSELINMKTTHDCQPWPTIYTYTACMRNMQLAS